MATPAQNLLGKCLTGEIFKKSSPSVSAEKAISEFSDHLKWLKSRHIKKSYSDEYLINSCFGKTRTLNNKDEANAYCRTHLVVAIKSFDELLKELRGNNQSVSHSNLRRYSEVVRDYVYDLKPIAEHLEKRKDPNYVFFSGAKSYHIYTFELFRLSRQLAIQSAFRKLPFHIDHKASQIASVFVLRQALEAKLERLIAVNLYNSTGSGPKLKHGFHYEFIASNPSYFTFNAVNFNFLEKIYEWCNEVVHRAYQPLAWQIAFAHSICGGLFYPINTPPNAAWSIHNAVEITNILEMQSAFINHFNKSYAHGIWAAEAREPEAIESLT